MEPDRTTGLILLTDRLLPTAAVAVALVLGLAWTRVVPPGEAPDEPAHLAYVEHLREHATTPRFDPARPGRTYEAHQPPLGYAWLAATADALGLARVGAPFEPDPRLDFRRPGGRAHLAIDATGGPAVALRELRRLQLPWAALAILAGAAALARLAPDDPARQAAALSALLAPQLLFTCATINNDAAAIGLASAALAAFTALAIDGRGRHRTAAVAGVLAASAAWAKLGALGLGAPLFVLAFALGRAHRDGRLVAALVGPWAAGVAALFVWNRERIGVLWRELPRFSGGDPRASLAGLATDWTWPLSLWRSFWAKFGWFNLPLPGPVYLLFVPVSLLALLGLVRAVRGWRTSGLSAGESRVAAVAASALGGNLLLLLVFTVLTGWRPQGRLLLPSIVAVALLAALGLAELERRVPRLATERARRAIAGATILSMVLVHLVALEWTRRAYEIGPAS